MASLLSALEKIQNLDTLPDDMLIEPKVSRILRHSSEWRDRRLEKAGSPLVPRRIKTSPKRYMHNLGDVRRIMRGEVQAR
jgi:hypothetical protein